MVGGKLGEVQGSWQMESEEDSTREEGINWIIQPNTVPVWLWKSILFPLTIPVLAHFNCTILLSLKETDSKSNSVREESSMAFGAHKSTHFIFQSRTSKSHLLLKDSCHAPVTPGSSPPPDSVFYCCPSRGLLHCLPPPMTSFSVPARAKVNCGDLQPGPAAEM